MFAIQTLPIYTLLVPVVAAILTVVARNPIHAILGLITTFLTTCGLVFHHFKLGFTCSLIIIVYVGAIAILFLFIVMMIPIKDRPAFTSGGMRLVGQFVMLATMYVAGGYLIFKQLVSSVLASNSEFGARFSNQVDVQALKPYLSTKEVEGLNLSDLYLDDIAIYGVKLYQDCAFPIILVGLVLLFVLVAAIVLCKEE